VEAAHISYNYSASLSFDILDNLSMNNPFSTSYVKLGHVMVFLILLSILIYPGWSKYSLYQGSTFVSGWVVWIHEELQLDALRLVRVRPINLFHLLHLENQRNLGVLAHRRRQSSGGFGKLA
jgi:hypothetical protein